MFDKFGCKVTETIRSYTKRNNFESENDMTTRECIEEAFVFLEIKLTEE